MTKKNSARAAAHPKTIGGSAAPPTKKALGQHWLSDEASLDAMLAGAEVQRGDVVLEIGPGPGTLTAKLLAAGAQVIAVEFDETLARDLPQRVSHLISPEAWEHHSATSLLSAAPGPDPNAQLPGSLRVVQQDIMRFDLTSLPPHYKVVANIPYYLTSNLLRVLCESPNPFARAALLIQKEVAERVCAGPGELSVLALSVQFYCEPSLGPIVPAALFTPPPKVDSQVLQLKRRPAPLCDDVEPRAFFRLIKAGFAQRRKTLANSLSGGLQLERDETAALLQAAGIAPTARAQTLSLDDWHRLYHILQK